MKHRRVAVNGVTLSVMEAGPPEGELVILLHGFPGFWYSWRAQIDHLAAQGYRVWAPDQRGYTTSDKPRELAAYRLDELARDVVELIAAAGAEDCILAGHDWGGAVAWWVALKYPASVAKLIIFNSPHPRAFGKALKEPEQRRRSFYMTLFQPNYLPEWALSAGDYHLLGWALRHSGPGAFSLADLRAYKAAWAHPGAVRGMLAWYRASFQEQNARVKSWRVSMPTLIIWGLRDTVFVPALAQMSAAQCEQHRLVTMPEAHHWPMLEAPDRVHALLDDFLRPT